MRKVDVTIVVLCTVGGAIGPYEYNSDAYIGIYVVGWASLGSF